VKGPFSNANRTTADLAASASRSKPLRAQYFVLDRDTTVVGADLDVIGT